MKYWFSFLCSGRMSFDMAVSSDSVKSVALLSLLRVARI